MTLQNLAALSLEESCQQIPVDLEICIPMENKPWRAYEASIAHRDILLLCDKGTATFLVDTYGDRNTIELFDWAENV